MFCATKKKLFLIIVFCFSIIISKAQRNYSLTSPDKHLRLNITVTDSVRWELYNGDEKVIQNAVAGLKIIDKPFIGLNEKVKNTEEKFVNETIIVPIAIRSQKILDTYSELSIFFKSGNKIIFRAFDNGIAYRWASNYKDSVEVENEVADFQFTKDDRVFWGSDKENDQYQSHYEQQFKDTVLSAYNAKQFCTLPLYVSSGKTKMLISEADLLDYPNLFLHGTGSTLLTSGFPKVITMSKQIGDRGIKVLENAPYIAKTSGTRTFPWRVVMAVDEDKKLIENNLIYQLASSNKLSETNWISPGKVAWDWWNDNNIYDVNFKSGINNETYKYYIDFAAKFGLQYIILDEGWSKTTWDLTHPAKDIDIPELVQYGKSKGIGVILWALWLPMDKDMNAILDTYVQWGVKGVKVDFMARADQYMVNFYERLAKAAAARKMMVDLHGAYKPVGLNRTYPNIISYEGVKGLENYKWTDEEANPPHDVTIPFTRMVVGPMDYTPGAMRNTTKKDFRALYDAPMSEGTRAHQVAMYSIYESPLQMLADNPSNYLKDTITTNFIAAIPTTWDTTIALDGKINEYVAVARKNGNKWYIGVMTNWTSRTLTLHLNFLRSGKHYKLSYFGDGINADRFAEDYTTGEKDINAGEDYTITMQTGGGWAAVITEK